MLKVKVNMSSENKSQKMNEHMYAFLVGKKYPRLEFHYHLFEHLLLHELNKLKNDSVPEAFTTEDYMFFLGQGISDKKGIFKRLKKMQFENEIVDEEMKIIKNEIKSQSDNLFNYIWEGTKYENHPIGIFEANIKNVRNHLNFIKNDIEMDNIFYFPIEAKDDNIFNRRRKRKHYDEFINIWTKIINRDQKLFYVYYFDISSDILFLIEEILSLFNKNEFIQYSDKRYLSALIVEKGTIFPQPSQISNILECAKNELNLKIKRIKRAFFSKALNELESLFFYERRWEDRINRCLSVNESEVEKILEILKNHNEFC